MPPEPVGSEVDDFNTDAEGTLSEMNDLFDKGDKGSEGERREERPERKSDDDLSDILPPKKGDEDEDEVRREKPEKEEEEEEEDLVDEEEEAELRAAGEPQLAKEIEKKYPKFFKEFKPVRVALLRDASFSQIFGTPREAAETAQLNEDYREFETEILHGNNVKVLKAIQQTNANGYQRFVSNFLPALREMDEGAYREVSYSVAAEVLSTALAVGEARGDKNIVNSTKHLASLIWPQMKGGIPKITAPEKTNPELDERERRLSEREKQVEHRDSQEFVGHIKSTCNRLLRKRIEKGLDPHEALSPFLKNSVIEKTMESVQELMNEDLQFNRVMERTFGRAKRSGYTNEYRTRMVGTFLGRAAQLVGPIRRRLLLAALGKSEGGEEGREKPPVRRDAGEGSSGGGREKALKASDIDFSQSSDYDILSGKAKLRRPNKG